MQIALYNCFFSNPIFHSNHNFYTVFNSLNCYKSNANYVCLLGGFFFYQSAMQFAAKKKLKTATKIARKNSKINLELFSA